MNSIVRYLGRVLLLTFAAIVSLFLSWGAQAAPDPPQTSARPAVCGDRSPRSGPIT